MNCIPHILAACIDQGISPKGFYRYSEGGRQTYIAVNSSSLSNHPSHDQPPDLLPVRVLSVVDAGAIIYSKLMYVPCRLQCRQLGGNQQRFGGKNHMAGEPSMQGSGVYYFPSDNFFF